MTTYHNKPIAELSTQLCAGLVRLRKGYVDSAEALEGILQDDVEYPYDFVVFRLTGYRPPPRDDIPAMKGLELRSDMRLLILDLCASFAIRTSDYDEQINDLDSLAGRFGVSTKTVQRWMQAGLVARRLVFPDGRRRLSFLESSVQRFAAGNGGRISRSSRFSRLGAGDKAEIIRKARRISAGGRCGLLATSRRIAARTGRSVETIRATIRRHDEQNPSAAIFPADGKGRGESIRLEVYQQYLQGEGAVALAQRYGRTRGSIYRMMNEVRAEHLLSRPIEYIYNPQFDLEDAQEVILGPAEAVDAPVGETPRPPRDLPPYLRELYETPLLSAAQEQDLFRRYNYLKHRASGLRGSIDPHRPNARDIKEVESLLLRANIIKNRIVRANLRLVVSIAKRHVSGPMTLFELISDGNVSLMKAVERFDFSRGHRFSTYASWAIMRNYAHTVPHEQWQLDRFATGVDDVVEIASGLRVYDPDKLNVPELRESIDAVLATLSGVERTILIDHYGLDRDGSVKTLQQLGKNLGLSKERVRQIEQKALGKLREILAPENKFV